MPTTLSHDWHSRNHSERRQTHQDDKHLKAFVGIVLFVVIGFLLAGLHPVSHTDSPDVQTKPHIFIRPAN